MFVFKTLITILALGLASTVSARPTHIRRGTCHASLASAVVAAQATPSPIDSTTTHSSTSPSATPSSSSHSSSSHSATASKSSSSAEASPSPSGNDPASGGLVSALFPVAHAQSDAWTTSSSGSPHVSLSDSTFRPTHLMSSLSHNYLTFSGKSAMQAHYPKGSWTPANSPAGGLSFYAPGPSDVDLTTAKEATLGYSVFFGDGFEFNKGGKLPGLYGGNSASEAISCSGGRRDDGCFSARLMWRTGGLGELYTYLPPSFSANKAVCDVAPMSTCNDVYGASVGRGSFNWKAGSWNTVSQRVRLNDVGKSNGELELFANGKSVINVGGLVLRNADSGRIQGIQMQTFFGGSTNDWASPRDQDTYFADFSVAITEKL